MPSPEFLEYRRQIAEHTAANPPPVLNTLEERRDHLNQTLGARPMVSGVQAREIDANGVMAMLLTPDALLAQDTLLTPGNVASPAMALKTSNQQPAEQQQAAQDGAQDSPAQLEQQPAAQNSPVQPPASTPTSTPASNPVICYFHGGGYRLGSATAWKSFGSQLAEICEAQVLLVDYRLAPEHPFPAAVEDALSVWRWLCERVSPTLTVVAGDSAGGGLAAALCLAARDNSLPSPAGCVCLSPWSNLTNSGESFDTCAETDELFSRQAAQEAAQSYLAGGDPTHHHASPTFGNWENQPPLLVHAGSVEVLLDDSRQLAEAARCAGVDVRHRIFEGMPHVWHISYPAFPEAVEAVTEVAEFVKEVTNSP